MTAQEVLAEVRLRNFEGVTQPVVVKAQYPMKILTRRVQLAETSTPLCILHLMSHGGGLLSSDSIDLCLELGAMTSASLITQSSTKVYRRRRPQDESRQTITARIASDAMLAVLPHPVVCFEESRYRQKQVFHMEQHSSLVVIDWVTAGRIAAGEMWTRMEYRSDTEIIWCGRRVLTDRIELCDTRLMESLRERMKGFHAIVTIVVIGPRFYPLIKILKEDSKRREENSEGGNRWVCAITELEGVDHGVVFRAAAKTTIELDDLLNARFALLRPVVGYVPWDGNM
mmetsp:Transcript_459/g.852  ORF Transcript_459/g.852 Transcript_459/m.852 type:complete len:285 (+) Transcript_459:234-1088(+)